MVRATALTTSINNLVAEAAVLTIDASSSIIGNTTPMVVAISLIVGAIVLATGSNGQVSTSLTPTVSVAEPLVLVVCLKNFNCHTKHLNIFYEKYFTCITFYL